MKEMLNDAVKTTVNNATKNNTEGGYLSARELTISVAKIFKHEFFWVSNSKAADPISNAAKSGHIAFPSSLSYLAQEPPGCFLDLGANIGMISLALAACGWSGYAIEASEVNCKALKKSIMLNDFDIALCQKGVWCKSGNLYFIQNGPWGVICEFQNGTMDSIEVICLDEYSSTDLCDMKRLDFIKMDIEGSEVAALEGMGLFLKRFEYPCIFAEANAFTLYSTRKNTVGDMIRQASQYGYETYKFYDDAWHRINDVCFIEEICTDYMFIHTQNKDRFRGPIGENHMVLEQEKSVRFIVDWLNAYLLNPDDSEALTSAIGICATLREFPELKNVPVIDALLYNIRKLDGANEMLLETIL